MKMEETQNQEIHVKLSSVTNFTKKSILMKEQAWQESEINLLKGTGLQNRLN
jgi:hypothetical protein